MAGVLSLALTASLCKAALVPTGETRWMGTWIPVPKHVHLFSAAQLSFGVSEHDCSVGYQVRGSKVSLIKETDFKP